ncbi:MAG: TrkA C-terminal domain-containing protein [Candidatus Scatomorpha sp.]
MNNKNVVAPVYSQIALDIAMRISRGEIQESTKLYGRSVLASQYGVSPETIRRAIKILEDVQIVKTHESKGSEVISKEKAKEYVNKFSELNDIRVKQRKLKELLDELGKLSQEINEIASSIVRINEHFTVTSPFVLYEEVIPETSPLIGKTLGEVRFWQQTNATVIAIRRGDQIILSPGPYATLMAKDIIIYIGDTKSVEAVISFIKG